MIEGIVTGDREVAARFQRIPDQVKKSVRNSIARIVLRLQAKIVREKLQGQVLKVRTGTLQRSIDQVVRDDFDGVTGIVWTNVAYARRHEYGFVGTETVKAHLRAVSYNARGEIMKGRTKRGGFEKSVHLVSDVMVREHTRKVNYPEHSFMRTALREMSPEIVAELERAVAEGVH